MTLGDKVNFGRRKPKMVKKRRSKTSKHTRHFKNLGSYSKGKRFYDKSLMKEISQGLKTKFGGCT